MIESLFAKTKSKMKICALLLTIAFSSLCWEASVIGQEAIKLDVPANWRSEAVNLPPPFAPEVKLKGKARVYFSPGWPKKNSDQFFTYAFLFKTKAEPKYDKKLIEKELLAYFGGLASRVSRGAVKASSLKMQVKEVKPASGEPKVPADDNRFEAQLKWTEPFFTKSEQTLNMEIVSKFNEEEKANYLMVCVSPQDPKSKAEASSKVWKELRKIQEGFAKPKKMETPKAMEEEKSEEPVAEPAS